MCVCVRCPRDLGYNKLTNVPPKLSEYTKLKHLYVQFELSWGLRYMSLTVWCFRCGSPQGTFKGTRSRTLHRKMQSMVSRLCTCLPLPLN